MQPGAPGCCPHRSAGPRAEGGEGGDVHASPSALGFTLRKERSWHVALAQEGAPAVTGAEHHSRGCPGHLWAGARHLVMPHPAWLSGISWGLCFRKVSGFRWCFSGGHSSLLHSSVSWRLGLQVGQVLEPCQDHEAAGMVSPPWGLSVQPVEAAPGDAWTMQLFWPVCPPGGLSLLLLVPLLLLPVLDIFVAIKGELFR